MKFSELNIFNRNTKNLVVDGAFNERCSFGQEWGDVPFEGVDIIRIESCEIDRMYFTKSLPYQPTWIDILMKLDDLITESGDHHHFYLEGIWKNGKTLHVDLGS